MARHFPPHFFLILFSCGQAGRAQPLIPPASFDCCPTLRDGLRLQAPPHRPALGRLDACRDLRKRTAITRPRCSRREGYLPHQKRCVKRPMHCITDLGTPDDHAFLHFFFFFLHSGSGTPHPSPPTAGIPLTPRLTLQWCVPRTPARASKLRVHKPVGVPEKRLGQVRNPRCLKAQCYQIRPYRG